jgi:CheY-like chemotaxis protein
MRLKFEAVKLDKLVNAARDVVSGLLNQKKDVKFKAKILKDAPEYFSGDLVKIKQILVNLLSNAVKFTVTGTIALTVKSAELSDVMETMNHSNSNTKTWAAGKKFLKFVVKDTGVGVSSRDFEKIFSAFEQASTKKEGEIIGGTGLGLNICLLLVKLMQGAISIKSPGPSKGSTFTFWVPYEEVAMDKKEEVEGDGLMPNGVQTRPPAIFLIEDNTVNQTVIKGQLAKLGCTVEVASNGLIAVDKMSRVSKSKFDLILLDLEMPVKDGITTVTELREMGVTTPIIALTAHAVEEKRTMALKAGMDDFLMKPCSIDTLKQCLDKYRHKFK